MREDKTKKRVSNFFLHYMLNVGLGAYAFEKMSKLKQGEPLEKIELEIRATLSKNNIPAHWIKTVLNIVKNEDIVNPDHEYISLKIGDEYIFLNDFSSENVAKLKGSPLSIEINGKVSKTELKKFIDRHEELIDEISELLSIPQTKYQTGTSFDENLMASLFNEQGFSASEVAKLVNPNHPDSGDYSTTKKKIRRGNKTRDNS